MSIEKIKAIQESPLNTMMYEDQSFGEGNESASVIGVMVKPSIKNYDPVRSNSGLNMVQFKNIGGEIFDVNSSNVVSTLRASQFDNERKGVRFPVKLKKSRLPSPRL